MLGILRAFVVLRVFRDLVIDVVSHEFWDKLGVVCKTVLLAAFAASELCNYLRGILLC